MGMVGVPGGESSPKASLGYRDERWALARGSWLSPGRPRGGTTRLSPLDPDHAAFLDRERQLAALELQCGIAEQLAAPAA